MKLVWWLKHQYWFTGISPDTLHDNNHYKATSIFMNIFWQQQWNHVMNFRH